MMPTMPLRLANGFPINPENYISLEPVYLPARRPRRISPSRIRRITMDPPLQGPLLPYEELERRSRMVAQLVHTNIIIDDVRDFVQDDNNCELCFVNNFLR